MRYLKKLGIPHRGDRAEADVQVAARVTTKGICAFATLPHVFTTIGLARQLLRDATPEEHSNEFATLLSVVVIYFSRDATLLSVMTTNLALLLLVLTVGMGAFAAISAIKRTRIAPAF